MAIVEIFIIVSLYLYVLFRVPQLRVAGGVVAVALLGGLVFYLFATEPEPQAELDRISVDEITLSDLDLQLGLRTSALKGRVVNGSQKYALTGITLEVKLFDCPDAQSPLAECFTIGDDDGYARVSVPPGQLRDFEATLLFTNLPEITGTLRWTNTVTSLRAIEVQVQ